jgi:signal transduction histidine kinase/CheY-like chemotaxis protein
MASLFPSDPAQMHTAMARWFAELTHEGIVATDGDLRVIVWNRWMEIHTRRSAADALGQPLLQIYPDLVARGLDRRFEEALRDGRVSTLSHGLHGYVLALPPTHPDLGLAEMPQSGRIGPLKDGDAIIGTVTVIENVSERLANEVTLRTQVEAQKTARAAAETALRVKDEFLSTLSHELRTPLNAVLGWARILLARKETNPEVIARALQVIERNAAAQAAMIDDILDVARIVSGKLRLDLLPADLAPVILAAVDVITPSATAKRIKVRTSLDPDTPQVLGDQGRLQQIAWNLLSNAVKFSDPGGAIDIVLAPRGDSVQLSISDRGRGIAPAFLPYVFDRFRQSDASSARRQGGLGLGLALVRDLVELHGGTIRAESGGEQQGAAFVVDLPIAQQAATALGAAGLDARGDVETPSLAGVLALVVEDEDDSRELLVAALVRYGAEVVAVSSCIEALERLEAAGERPIDVLVSDIGMPRHDGYELMHRLRALEQQRSGHVPAVAVTGYATESDRNRALAAGYADHVPKPIDPMSVAVAIKRAIQNASVR